VSGKGAIVPGESVGGHGSPGPWPYHCYERHYHGRHPLEGERFAAIYTSPLRRASETAALAAPGRSILRCGALREIHFDREGSTMTSVFRIGVLGMTHDHLWGELPNLVNAGARLVAAADHDDGLRERAQREHGCSTYGDSRELLDAHELDAVYVFSDNATSVALAELALERVYRIERDRDAIT
jgi:hypothetical protein